MSTSTQEWPPTLTESETVLFDLKGYILFPAVLSEGELAPIEKIRLEGAFLSYRFKGDNHRGWTPHAGGKSVNPNYGYQYHDETSRAWPCFLLTITSMCATTNLGLQTRC